jgi:hypothetical protein
MFRCNRIERLNHRRIAVSIYIRWFALYEKGNKMYLSTLLIADANLINSAYSQLLTF